MLTVTDLLHEATLALTIATPGIPTDRRVAGGHVVEMSCPGDWLAPDYLALTTGVGLKGDRKSQREFVRSISDAGGAGLAFGVGVTLNEIPKAIIETGRSCSLPILSVPYEVPFRDILTFIARSTLATGFQDFNRALRMQDYLLASLEDADAEASLARRIADLVNGRVALFAPDGRVLAAFGRPPTKEMWQTVRSGSKVCIADRKRLIAKEVRVAGTICYHLSAAVQDNDRSELFGAEVLRFGARVAQALSLARKSALAQEEASRGGLLVALLSAAVPHYEAALRLRAFAFSIDGPLRLLAARQAGGQEDVGDVSRGNVDRLTPILEACQSFFHELGVPYLSAVVDGRVIAIWQDDQEGTAVLEGLAATVQVRAMAVGLSRPVDGVAGLNQASSEAALALAEAQRVEEPAVVDYDQLGLSEMVLASSHPEVAARAKSILEPLRDGKPELFETLVAYLEHDCDVVKCSKALYIHPNTLRYRLSRIETALGRPLRSVATLADLYLALRV